MSFAGKLFVVMCGLCWVIVMMARMGLIRTGQGRGTMRGAQVLRSVLPRRGARDPRQEIEVHSINDVHHVRDVDRVRGMRRWSRLRQMQGRRDR